MKKLYLGTKNKKALLELLESGQFTAARSIEDELSDWEEVDENELEMFEISFKSIGRYTRNSNWIKKGSK